MVTISTPTVVSKEHARHDLQPMRFSDRDDGFRHTIFSRERHKATNKPSKLKAILGQELTPRQPPFTLPQFHQ
jgi:hypothetical protein